MIGRDGKRREDAARDLGAARVVDDRHAPAARVLEEPAIGLGVPRLARRADDAERREIVLGDPVGAVRHERARGRRRDAEVRDAMPLAEVPEAIGLRIVGRALEEHDGRAVKQRARDEHRPHEPAEVGDPEHPGSVVHVEDVGPVVRVLDPEAALREHGALRPPRGPRRVDDQGRMIGLNGQGFALRRLGRHGLVPPDVAARRPGNVGAGSPVHDHVPDRGAFGDRLVGGSLHRDHVAAAGEGVGRDQHFGVAAR